MTQSPEAVRARAARRRHMQQRQTVVFGSLVAGLLVVGLVGGAVWANIIPSPVSVPISSPETPTAAPVVPPCPPEGALPVPYGEITVNVLNGTETAGLAGRTATSLRGYGLRTDREDNGTPYSGVARIVTGPRGVAAAYSVAPIFSGSQVELDQREDESVDVVIGAELTDLVPEADAALPADEPLAAPEGCQPVEVSAEDG